MLQKYYIEKILPNLIVCFFVFNLTAAAGAATVIWSGGGADDFASTPGNWTGSVPPQNADAVIFDSTSSKNCTWDLNITLSLLSINPGYPGTVTIASGLTIDNGFTWTGDGGDNLASNPANWSAGTAPRDGDNIDFDGMKDCLWDLDISPASLILDQGFTATLTLIADLPITGDLIIQGGFLDLHDKALSADGDLLIGLNGTLYASSSIIRVEGDWINNGSFDSGNSTVNLNGANQIIYGDNTFFNFVKTTGSADTLYFEVSRTQTILNKLFLCGTGSNLLLLRSTVNETFWFIDPVSTRNISHADIRDMKNVNPVCAVADNSSDSGISYNVFFDIDQCL